MIDTENIKTLTTLQMKEKADIDKEPHLTFKGEYEEDKEYNDYDVVHYSPLFVVFFKGIWYRLKESNPLIIL